MFLRLIYPKYEHIVIMLTEIHFCSLQKCICHCCLVVQKSIISIFRVHEVNNNSASAFEEKLILIFVCCRGCSRLKKFLSRMKMLKTTDITDSSTMSLSEGWSIYR